MTLRLRNAFLRVSSATKLNAFAYNCVSIGQRYSVDRRILSFHGMCRNYFVYSRVSSATKLNAFAYNCVSIGQRYSVDRRILSFHGMCRNYFVYSRDYSVAMATVLQDI